MASARLLALLLLLVVGTPAATAESVGAGASGGGRGRPAASFVPGGLRWGGGRSGGRAAPN